MAAAYTDWLIAANGIASDLATSRSGILLLLLMMMILQGSRADVTPALGLLILITALPALGAKGMADARPSSSELNSGTLSPRMISITRCQKRRGIQKVLWVQHVSVPQASTGEGRQQERQGGAPPRG